MAGYNYNQFDLKPARVAASQTVNPFRFVSVSTTSDMTNLYVQQTALNGVPIGICLSTEPSALTASDGDPAAAGDSLAWIQTGVLKLQVDGSGTAIAAGDRIKSGANGIGLKAGDSENGFAVALEASSAANDVISVVYSRVDGTSASLDPANAAKILDADTGPDTFSDADFGAAITTIKATVNGTQTINIPGAATANSGRVLIVRKDGTEGAVTIDAASGNVAGAATYTAIDAAGEYAIFVSDGSGDWELIGATKGAEHKYITVAGAATYTQSDFGTLATYIFATTNGTQAITIPAGTAGQVLKVKKTGTAGAITLTPASGTIAGGANYAAVDAQNDFAEFVSDGTNWLLVNAVLA